MKDEDATIIHRRAGNCAAQPIANLPMDDASLIYEFISDPMESLLILE
jgi:hypothetical protein